MEKQNRWIVTLVALFSLFSSIAVSFAYFSAVVTIANDSISSVSGTADNHQANITLNNLTASVSLTGTFPMTDADAQSLVDPYSFQIVNNSTNRLAKFQVVLETASANTISNSLISAKIATSNSSNVGPLSTTYTTTVNTLTGYNNAYILYTGTLSKSETRSFDLRLYINANGTNDGGANDVQNKTWTGKIVVKAYDDGADTN